MQPKVTLLTAPVDWRRTIWNIWWSSKNEKTLQQIQREYDPAEFTKLFSKLLQMDVPILVSILSAPEGAELRSLIRRYTVIWMEIITYKSMMQHYYYSS